MSEHLANFNARLQALVRQITKEGDPLKYDELCAELWRVLDEHERFSTIETTPAGSAHPIAG